MLKSKYQGFTIFEIVVTLGILMAMALLVIPISMKQVKGTQAKALADEMSANIFTQQQNAFTGKNNKSYGIAFATNHYIVFTGTSLSTAEDTMQIDYPNDTSSTIALSGGATEFVFTPGSISPSNWGHVNITTATETYQVNINSEGLVQVIKQ